MNPVELIRKKRDGGTLLRDDIAGFIDAYLKGHVADYQMSAFLMAVYFKGMTADETAALTDVMLHSGTVIKLDSVPGIKVDKHSTGGVGDKVSLILAPMVAACGVPVPMISGRGLGHTGGTLDKLESIPGFQTTLGLAEYERVIRETGLVMIGQTPDIAPADKRMYALRDVTSTVESVPLIAGSIMSKKLAEGIDGLVLDIKTGDGAFMKSYDDSLALGRALVDIGTQFGKKTVGIISGMDEPLGFAIGNWSEMEESIQCLRGKRIDDMMEVTYALGALMLMVGGKVSSLEEGKRMCEESIWSGRAHEKFVQLVRAQGGNTAVVEKPSLYPVPKFRREVPCTSAGYLGKFRTREIGVLAAEMGAGRMTMTDVIDMKAGITLRKKLGDYAVPGESLAEVYGDDEKKVAMAADRFGNLVEIAEEPPVRTPLIRTLIDSAGDRPWVPLP
jgi:pyrimidine-nucleoside phosphorylase